MPRHMIPNRFVFVAGFPVTANGKLDRRKLAEAGWAKGSRSQVEDILHELAQVSDEEAGALLAGKGTSRSR